MIIMNFLGKTAAVTAALLLLLTTASCAASKPQATFDTVEELKAAFVEAGGICEKWSQTNKVEIASQSGECGTNTVLSVYLSSESLERRIETTKSSIFGSIGNDWLVGENWAINADDAISFQDKLGGRIVSFEAK